MCITVHIPYNLFIKTFSIVTIPTWRSKQFPKRRVVLYVVTMKKSPNKHDRTDVKAVPKINMI
jgi:hypothetical protein